MVTLSSCLIWQIICFILPPNEYGCVYAWTTLGSGPAIDLQKMPILAKKIIFSDEAHFDLGGYVNKQNCCIWGTENPHAYIKKPLRILIQSHNWAIFFFRKWAMRGRYCQWRSLSGHVERIFVHKNWRGEYGQHLVLTEWHYVPHSRSYTQCFPPCFWRSHYQKLKRRILATFGFNETALHVTQSKLHSMFCALFLKIALSAAELRAFGHLGAAVWHRWTIICGVPSKISVTPTSQRQLTL